LNTINTRIAMTRTPRIADQTFARAASLRDESAAMPSRSTAAI
jgi:hypothetical protein